jgi:hypothetical protein
MNPKTTDQMTDNELAIQKPITTPRPKYANQYTPAERRWTVFFGQLRLFWFSVPELYGAAFASMSFYMPSQRGFAPSMFFDVVESDPPQWRVQDYYVLSVHTGISIGILRPIPSFPNDCFADLCIHEIYCGGGGWDNAQTFCRCMDCGTIGFAYEGRSERIPCECRNDPENDGKFNNASDPLLVQAYKKALAVPLYS